MFVGDTFQSFLPLFNVHALFRPSKESGIGAQGKWKDTSFRLYRDGTELRGIYTANPRAARQACRAVGKYACDFPSLIGNDPYCKLTLSDGEGNQVNSNRRKAF